jgi:hypothetical protein
MSSTTRRGLLIAIPIAVFLLFVVIVLLFFRGQDLKSRSSQIPIGMSREEVEGMLGRPVLVLPRTAGRGFLLAWVDQFWQLDVYVGPEGRVEIVTCSSSNSLYRRTVGRVIPFP